MIDWLTTNKYWMLLLPTMTSWLPHSMATIDFRTRGEDSKTHTNSQNREKRAASHHIFPFSRMDRVNFCRFVTVPAANGCGKISQKFWPRIVDPRKNASISLTFCVRPRNRYKLEIADVRQLHQFNPKILKNQKPNVTVDIWFRFQSLVTHLQCKCGWPSKRFDFNCSIWICQEGGLLFTL